MRYVIGIDGGTESLRAHVFDTRGRNFGGAVGDYDTVFPAPGRAEQDPRDWWRAIGEAVRDAVRTAGIDARDVAALALDTTSAAIDLEDVRSKWPSEIVAPGEVVGPLTASAADHLALTTSTLVVQGGADAFIGMIGLGVARAGQLALVTGSSHLQLAVTGSPISAPGLWGSYADVVYPNRHVLEGGQSASGSMIAWLCRFIGPDVDLQQLNHEAAELPPGSEGLIVLDHFQGNRTPYTDALSRGALVGLSLSHGRAHVFRAMIEGICFGTR